MTTGTLFQSVTHQVSYSAVRRGARAQRVDRYDLSGQAGGRERNRVGVIPLSLAANSSSSAISRDAQAIVGHGAEIPRRRNSFRHVRDHVVPRSTGDAAASVSQGAEPDLPSPSSGAPAGFIANFVRGLRMRMAADPNFPFKLGAEVCLDEVMTVLVNIGVRGNPLQWALGAQLQVLCQMLTAAVNDIILVYCLAPVKQDGLEAKEKPKEPEIAHIFQEGDFTFAQRIGCYLAKGRFYALVGALSCTFSMALALLLSGQMELFTPVYLFRALMNGALHMGVSANTRYQIVNGIERVLYSLLPQNAARLASVGTRLSNNLLGARLWIVMTTLTGLA